MFNEEICAKLQKVWKANADKQQSLSAVIETSCEAFRLDQTGVGALVADIIGKSRTPERRAFLEEFKHQMPHVVYNNTKDVIIVDFVAPKKEENLLRAIKEYRLAGKETVVLEQCVGMVEDEREETAKEIVRLKSGFEVEVPSRDADGNIIKESKKVKLVPREKSIWGYTDVVRDAFIATLDVLMSK